RASMNVGFVGTGTMGTPMLANLVKKGFGVIAYDVVPAALANAEKRGATRAESAADAARRSDLVITMLPSSSHIETAYLGKNGIAEGLTAGRLCVDMSTVDPAVSRRVAQALGAKGVRFIDAPVSGGVPRAEEGTLAIMVGGEARDVEEARPALAAIGVVARPRSARLHQRLSVPEALGRARACINGGPRDGPPNPPNARKRPGEAGALLGRLALGSGHGGGLALGSVATAPGARKRR